MKAIAVLALLSMALIPTSARAEGGCGPYAFRNGNGYCMPYRGGYDYDRPRYGYDRRCPPGYYLGVDRRCWRY
jgi:hypothetical protein